jgi:hypothetical protein
VSYRLSQGNARPLQRDLSLAAFYSDVLVIAECLLAAGWLGLPAAMHALRLREQGLSYPQDRAANDERNVA